MSRITRLSQADIESYRAQGYLLVEDALTAKELADIRAAVDGFVEQSRSLTRHDATIELEQGHSADNPKVQRIKQPHRLHPAFAALSRSASVLDPVRALIGNDLRLIGSKVNIKAAHAGTSVEWHQDWAFYPHTNDDLLAVGVMMDDVTPENAPLLLLPGSHRGPVYDHRAEGVFVGGFNPLDRGLEVGGAVAVTGKAGSISLHHVRLVHGSSMNRSPRDRRMLFLEIAAADAWPLAGVPSYEDWFEGAMISGRPTDEFRMEALPFRMPYPRAVPGALGQEATLYRVQERLPRRYFQEAGAKR
jgi:ectoine hydroxylase-related dioxygenase (phytanoyl-CoA dioxygenase family)